MSDTAAADARFSIGRVISTTFGVIGRNFAAIIGLAVLVAVATTGLGFLIGLGFGVYAPKLAPLAGLIGGLLGIILDGIATGAITHLTISSLHGERETAFRAFGTGVALVVPISALSVAITLGVALGMLLLIIPGVLLALRWAVAIPTRVAEGPTISSALGRSADLTRGHRWAILGVSVAFLVLALVIQIPLAVLGTHAAPHGVGVLLISVVRLIVQNTLGPTLIAVCYVELRRIREGVTPSQLAAVFA